MSNRHHDGSAVKYETKSISNEGIPKRVLRNLLECSKDFSKAMKVPGALPLWLLTGAAWTTIVLTLITMIATASATGTSASAPPVGAQSTIATTELQAAVAHMDKRVDQTLSFVQWLVQLGGGTIAVLIGFGVWNKAESLRHLEEYQEKIAASQAEAHEKVRRLLDFHKDQLLLSKRIADLDEPFIRHTQKPNDEQLLNDYIESLKHLTELIGGEDQWTAYDHEQAGYAHHYLAKFASDEEREKHEQTAMHHYNMALRKHGNKPSDKPDWRTVPIYRKFGNACAGLRKYDDAISQYNRINADLIKGWLTEEALLYLSFGFSYKGKEEYLEAACYFTKAKRAIKLDEQNFAAGNRKDQQIFVEACYELANALTAFGEYDKAVVHYGTVLACAPQCGFSEQWLHQSYADTLRKRARAYPNDREKILQEYDKELRCNDEHNGAPHFRLGQFHVCESVLAHDDGHKKRSLGSACEQFKSAEAKGYREPLLYAYWGYAIKASGQGGEKSQEYLLKAIEEQQEQEKAPDKAQQKYYLAACHAMNGNHEMSLRLLDAAGQLRPTAYVWALEMESANFAGILDTSEWKSCKPRLTDRVEKITQEWKHLQQMEKGCGDMT